MGLRIVGPGMGIAEHPPQGSIVTVDYTKGFIIPEMCKVRLAVVLSPKIENRPHLMTVVPLSTTEPEPKMPYNRQIEIPFKMPPAWGNIPRWICGDMVNAVAFHRAELLRMGKDWSGKRIYQMQSLPPDLFKLVRRCALHGMGFSSLTKHL